ncbi:MAG: hypothetical protein OEU36_21425 [Gammaproteobacteria bacterium]|nr:hypothetical protein [Gammaproteobacteria bacterium]
MSLKQDSSAELLTDYDKHKSIDVVDAFVDELEPNAERELYEFDATPTGHRTSSRRVNTRAPAWKIIEQYREDKWLRDQLREVYD